MKYVFIVEKFAKYITRAVTANAFSEDKRNAYKITQRFYPAR